MEKDTGGTAFPLPLGGETVAGHEGMTLRDYFAAKAFAAVIGSLNGPVTGEEYPGDFDRYARCSYRMADAMLRARGQ